MLRYCCWKNNQYRNICFASVKVALIKRYHLHMCNRVLLWFGKLPQWNLHVNGTILESSLRFEGCSQWNCHENGTTFQSGWRFQTRLSSPRVSCKRALCKNWNKPQCLSNHLFCHKLLHLDKIFLACTCKKSDLKNRKCCVSTQTKKKEEN